LKEAAIIASVLAKNKVPVVHSSAALMRIANMDYAGIFVLYSPEAAAFLMASMRSKFFVHSHSYRQETPIAV
jgi:hypothetical protein